MSNGANVQSVQALDDFRIALTRFGSDAQEALKAIDREIQRTTDWLLERQSHWQNEVRRRRTEVDHAKAALVRCEASGYYDDNGYYHRPNCSAYENALRQAQVHLQESEKELQNVKHWVMTVQHTTIDYQQQARRLAIMLSNDVSKGAALLSRSLFILESYIGMVHTATSVESKPPGPSTPPEFREGNIGGPERRG